MATRSKATRKNARSSSKPTVRGAARGGARPAKAPHAGVSEPLMPRVAEKSEYNVGPGTAPESATPDVAEIRAAFGVTQPVFSRMTGFSVRAVAAWERGRALSDAARQRMVEMQRLYEGLAGVMNAAYIATWIESPAPAFGGLKPLELIERGQLDHIWRMIFFLESGTPA